MFKEKINQKTENERKIISENLDEVNEKLPENILDGIDKSSIEEKKSIDDVQARISEGDQNFQEEVENSGILNNLNEKMRNSKLLRASLVAFSLYNASPAFAAGFAKLEKSGMEQSKSEKDSTELKARLKQFENMSKEHKKELEQVYNGASDISKEKILKALDSEPLSEKDMLDSKSREDLGLLQIQQQVIDLQNSGEMAPRRKGGVILPFDSGHSKDKPGIEFTDDTVAEDGGKQKITIDNASENQIRIWIDSLKNLNKNNTG